MSKTKRYCLNCGKELKTYQEKYCSCACQHEFDYKEAIKSWKNGTLPKRKNKISSYVRRYMLEKANYQCELCGWNEINPTSGLSPLQIHHKDGNGDNDLEENLQVLCPNCHSLTPNYMILNRGQGRKARQDGLISANKKKYYCIDCGKEISEGSTRCRSCSDKNRIQEKPVSREELKNMIRTMPFTKIGERFGISDNAIRKWCDRYQLPRTKRDINQYTDEEWEKI